MYIIIMFTGRFDIPSGNLHPSEIQNVNINATNNIKNKRSIASIQKERDQALVVKDLSNLVSPGKFKFTDGMDISGSNTRFLFKNLYGETPLTFLFFSRDNINNIQNLIRYVVFKEVGQKIDNQDYTELMIIMRSIFLEYSQHPPLIDEAMSDEYKTALLKTYTKEVERLNELVINETVPKVISGLQAYLDYLKDSSTQPIPLAPPQNVSTAGSRSYRSITQVLTGSQL